MDYVRLGIIGCGNMGSGHIGNILSGAVKRVKVTALCDIKENKLQAAIERFPEGEKPTGFTDSKEILRSGLVDAVIIAVPHYFHPTIAMDAFANGVHVMSEKPIGVYTKIIHDEIAAAKKSGKIFGMMFNQRTNPMYIKMRDIIKSGDLGEIVRTNWIITDWFRSQYYYDSGDWRATWEGEGGGVLLNQCPHQIDLMQWICGMPKRVRAFAYEGKYHNIEVEDDVTAYFEYENGATGLFITTTGEFPGTNRFEVSGDKGKLIAEGNTLTWVKTTSVKENRETSQSAFPHMDKETETFNFSDSGPQHIGVLNQFIGAILDGTPLIAEGEEGINGLTISNAMHMSSWLDSWVELPLDEDRYYELLSEKIRNSTRSKKTVEDAAVTDISNTFGGAK